jgi:hypothetical protein
MKCFAQSDASLSYREEYVRTPQISRLRNCTALAISILRSMTNKHTIDQKKAPRFPSDSGSTLSPVEETTQKITRRYIRGTHPARVTRISIENQTADDSNSCKPRLKRGVRISAPGTDEKKSLIVISAHRAISIHYPGARAIIAKLDGEHSILDISDEIDAPIDIVEKVIEQLKLAQLLDVKTSKIKLHNRFQSPIAERAVHTEDQSNDASFKQLQIRMSSELSQTTWVDGVVDGGVELLSARQNFGVEIHGGNRLATLIFAALLASGVTNTKFSIASRGRLSSIGDNDLGTGALRITDFGLNFTSRIEELTREWSLFPTASKNVKGTISSPIPERNIRVVIGNYTEGLIEQLLRDKQNHLFVGQTSGGAAHIGPFVIPGSSPCMNCSSLGIQDRFGVEGFLPLSTESIETPVALTFHLAGVAVQAILQLIDTGESDLKGARLCFDYNSPVAEQRLQIARHPLCACQRIIQATPGKSTGGTVVNYPDNHQERILF